jgi:hypothetical protein
MAEGGGGLEEVWRLPLKKSLPVCTEFQDTKMFSLHRIMSCIRIIYKGELSGHYFCLL